MANTGNPDFPPMSMIASPVSRLAPRTLIRVFCSWHEHEWNVFKDVKLPDGKVIIPGVIDSTTNFIEHPELVAQRIVRYAELVGRENLAGSDCGFGTSVRSDPAIAPDFVWPKLKSMAEGAKIASRELW